MEKKKYYTIREIAELTGIAQVTVTLHCRKGRIKAIQPGGPGCRWLVSADEVEHLLTPVGDQTK